MKTLWIRLAFCILFVTTSAALHAEEPQNQTQPQKVFFARSGQRVTIPGAVQLRYLNATLPVVSHRGVPMFTIPKLRAPCVLGAYNDSGKLVREFVAYPEKITTIGPEPEQTFLAEMVDPPDWFLQWSEATRLFEKKKTPDSPDAEEEKPRLLILGPEATGHSTDVVRGLLKEKGLKTALVFNPRWSGPDSKKPKRFDLAKAKGPLLENYQALGDLSPLVFSQIQTPSPKIMNRIAWLRPVKDELPYVEELLTTERKYRILVSYIPWEEQLGRSDQMDHLLRHLLVKAAEDFNITK
ncbi:MAG: hypothetical protein PVH19_06130, partial [Planctomycetia bacterium]